MLSSVCIAPRTALPLPILTVATLVAAACVSAPPCVHRGAAGSVHARTPEKAQAVAEMMDRFAIRLLSELPGTDVMPLSVWVQERPQAFWWFLPDDNSDVFHSTLTNRIHLAEGSPTLELDLAHELVHAVVDESWDAAPPAVMEGICDRMAVRIAPASAPLHANRLMLATAALGGPRLVLRVQTEGGSSTAELSADSLTTPVDDPGRVFDRSDAAVDPFHGAPEKGSMYGLGYLVAGRLLQRCGIVGTHTLLVATARLPEEEARSRLAAAAGLGGSRIEWQAALAGDLARQLPAVASGMADSLVEGMRQWARSRGATDLRAAIEAADPRLGVTGREETVRLMAVPAFVERL